MSIGTGSLDDLAKRHFGSEYDLANPDTTGVGFALEGFFAVTLGAVAGMLFAVRMDYPGAFLVVVLSAVAGFAFWKAITGTRSSKRRKFVSDCLTLYRAGDPETVVEVQRFAVGCFRQEIQVHRDRTIGVESEWGKARAQLSAALDEARQLESYWRLRLEGDDKNDVARRACDEATRLEEKLSHALGRADSRADVLLKFYSDCEARLHMMDNYSHDMEKARQLERLSDRADIVIAEAEGTLSAIGQQFVHEAQLVGRAMSGLAEMQAVSLAGEVPLDDMEFLADRVVERSEMDERAIRKLDASISGDVE